MQEQLIVLKNFIFSLEQAKISYMLSGSVAMSYYTQPRMTRDIDLVIEMQQNDLQRLISQLGDDDYYFDEETARTAIVEQGMFNIIHFNSLVKIDCIVRKNSAYRLTEFARRQRVILADFAVWIVSAEDLILSKLDWLKDSRSEMQFKDIRNLVGNLSGLDWRYLSDWSKDLGILTLLDEVRP